MYLVSIYFDESTDKRIRQYIKQVAKKSGNYAMIDGDVPPHITISAFETKHEDEVIQILDQKIQSFNKGMLQWVSIGVFLPQVIYLAPVLNEYLHELSVAVYESIFELDGIIVRKCYQPLQWMPHTTIGKQLSKEEMANAFVTLQNNFHVFKGEVTKIGLAKTNPYRDIALWELESNLDCD